MDSEIKKGWVKALRSGSYIQGKNYLHQRIRENEKEVEKFCCLGVLCEIVKEKLNLGVSLHYGAYFYDEEKHYLPKKVLENLFQNEEIHLKVEERFYRPAVLNDNGFTFSQIADLIEEQL